MSEEGESPNRNLRSTTVIVGRAAFGSNQGDDPAVQHSFANKRVLAHLRSRLELGTASDFGGISVGAINEATRALLMLDSEQRSGGRRGTGSAAEP